VRSLVVLVAILAATGCPGSSKDASLSGDDFSGDAGVLGNPAPAAPCSEDTDCALAGASCCACPSFAVAASDPGLKSCGSIQCPMMDCPTNLRAACTQGTCQVACAATTCGNSCPEGFAADASGCLTCACFQPGPETCAKDSDCAEVPAECCGCARGGADLAILASQAASYEASLQCPQNPQCPDQNTCTPGVAPHCIQGNCLLESPEPLPGNACGRSDLPACPAGQVCVLNADPSADRLGVGVCTPP
jgi:hypothetical protein